MSASAVWPLVAAFLQLVVVVVVVALFRPLLPLLLGLSALS